MSRSNVLAKFQISLFWIVESKKIYYYMYTLFNLNSRSNMSDLFSLSSEPMKVEGEAV